MFASARPSSANARIKRDKLDPAMAGKSPKPPSKSQELKKTLKGTPADAEGAARDILKDPALHAEFLDVLKGHKQANVRALFFRSVPSVLPNEAIDLLRRAFLDEDDESVAIASVEVLLGLPPSPEAAAAWADIVLTSKGRWPKRDAGRPPKPWYTARERAIARIREAHPSLEALGTNRSFLDEIEYELLESPVSTHRKIAAQFLGEMKARGGVHMLLQALGNLHSRLPAAETLWLLRVAEAQAPIEATLPSVRDPKEQEALRAVLAKFSGGK